MIKSIERFVCLSCGYITESGVIIDLIRKSGACPACQNGKSNKWTKLRNTTK